MENLLKKVTALNEEIAKLEKERLVAKSKKEMIEKSLFEKLKKYQEEYGVNLSGKTIADIEDALTNELNKVASKCESEFDLKEKVVNAIKSGDVSTARKLLGIDEDVKVPKEESRVNVTPVEEEQEEVEESEGEFEEEAEEEPEMEFDEPEEEPEEEPEDESEEEPEMELDEPEVASTPVKKTPTKKAPTKKTPVVEEEEDFTDISDDMEEAKVPDDEDDDTNMSNFGSFSFDDEDDEDDTEFILGNSPKSVARGNAEYKQKLTSVEKSVEEVEKGTAEKKKAEKPAPKKPSTSFLFDDDDDGDSLGFKSLLNGSKFQV